jgi:hypothetical protein
MNEEIAYSIQSMQATEAWARLDTIYNRPKQLTKELMLEIQAIPMIKELDFKKQLEYYMLLQDKIKEAAWENQEGIFLSLKNTKEMT